MNRIAVGLLILSCFITGCIGGDFCGKIGLFGVKGKYCDYGCCDNDCCTTRNIFTTWIIVAIVVGSLIGLVALVSICVCICCCLCSNKSQRPGQVVVPPPTTHVIYSNGTVQTAGMPLSYSYPSPITQTNLHQVPSPYGNNPQTPNANTEPGYNPNKMNHSLACNP